MNERIEAIVIGKVQGVYFRGTTVSRALELGLTGYAKNLSDGSVEVIAEGKKEKIAKFVEFLHKGPMTARVDKVKINYSPAINEFEEFRTKY